MSEQSVIAIIAVIASGSVGTATVFFNYLSHKAASQEQYRIGLYQRRVAAYQEAVEKLVDLQNVVFYTPPLRDEVRVRFHKMFNEADHWWKQNCLYLDPGSAEELRKLFLQVGAWAVWGESLPPNTSAPDFFNRTWRALWKGMGWKHVDPAIAKAGLKHER